MEVMPKRVKIEVMDETKQLIAFWPSTGVPNEANFSFKTDELLKQKQLSCSDSTTNLRFIGDDSMNKSCTYYIGIRDRNVMTINSIAIYRMDPIIELSEETINGNSSQTPLTIREQLDEMKEKFGSRKTQRSLASKRKYAIEFGEDDVNDIQSNDSNDKSRNESLFETTNTESGFNGSNGSNNVANSGNTVDILPQQNRDAISVDNVYQLNDIIKENERIIINELEEELFAAIENPFILNLISDSSDSTKKTIAIYINLIIEMLQLKAPDMRKADPLPSLNSNVKEFLFLRYTYSQQFGKNKSRYIISDKEKDRLLIYGIILSLMLYNYRPIDMELLQKSFKVPLRQLRRLIEVIGCYVENSKNASGVNVKCVVLKIPLNTLKESKRRR